MRSESANPTQPTHVLIFPIAQICCAGLRALGTTYVIGYVHSTSYVPYGAQKVAPDDERDDDDDHRPTTDQSFRSTYVYMCAGSTCRNYIYVINGQLINVGSEI